MKGVRRVLISLFVSGSVLAMYVLPAMADGGGGGG
jgi:hypothetical protein